MDWFDELFQVVLGIVALTAMFRFAYAEPMLTAFVHGVAIVACYSLGRAGVKLARRRKQMQSSSIADD